MTKCQSAAAAIQQHKPKLEKVWFVADRYLMFDAQMRDPLPMAGTRIDVTNAAS
jgi:hypothetical protein